MRAAARRRTGCATPAAARWLPLLFSAASASTLTLCEDAASCGLVENMCGSTTDTLIQRNARVIVCVGFEAEGNEDPAAVTKAVFQVRVDKYSELKISSLRMMMGSRSWNAKKAHSTVFVAAHGRRTIGQHQGTVHATTGNCTPVFTVAGWPAPSAPPPPPDVPVPATCYGWRPHNKPLINKIFELAAGLTAVIHVNLGVVTRIVWDSSCNLCPINTFSSGLSVQPELYRPTCVPDLTNVSCAATGDPSCPNCCRDCRAQLTAGGCRPDSAGCTPTVAIAWLGTDAYGQPLLSAGSVLSRFAEYSLTNFNDFLTSEIEQLATEFDAALDPSVPDNDDGTPGGPSPSPPSAPNVTAG